MLENKMQEIENQHNKNGQRKANQLLVNTKSYRKHSEFVSMLRSFGFTDVQNIKFSIKNGLTTVNVSDHQKILFAQAKAVFDLYNKKQNMESTKVGFTNEFPKPEEYLELMKKAGFLDHVNAYKKVLDLSQAIKDNNGQALLVGGSVRDALMKKISKDFDLEIYGVESDKVEEIAKKIGKVSSVGKAFGILKVSLKNGLDIDVSLPRTDSKINAGHRGFAIKTDPYMSIKNASRRRDFTINSVAADPLTGKLYDHFNGVSDIKNRILRITDVERFKDDPLRVLRAVQFVGRFNLNVDEKSMFILKEMVPFLKELPKERIGEEWKKLLLKSEKPSKGLDVGMKIGMFNEIHPEFVSLTTTPQDPKWHPEGNVWVHTLMSVDEASKNVRKENLDSTQALTVLLSTLCHDLGKPQVTERNNKGRITSHGHGIAGEEPTKRFLESIGIDNLTKEKVVKLVTNHLVPEMLYADEKKLQNSQNSQNSIVVGDGAIRRLAKKIYPATINELVLVAKSDHFGRGQNAKRLNNETKQQYIAGQWLLEKAEKLRVKENQPKDLTRGKDWLNTGFKPGKDIGKLIKLSNDLRDEKGFSKEMIFNLVGKTTDSNKAISKLQFALKKEKNKSKQISFL